MKLTPTTWKVTMADLEKFQDKLTAFFHKIETKDHPTLPKSSVEIEVGQKFARIWKIRGYGSRSAYAFVDMTNGDLLKPATWRAPAKHARGNIFAKNPLGGCEEHSMAYLR